MLHLLRCQWWPWICGLPNVAVPNIYSPQLVCRIWWGVLPGKESRLLVSCASKSQLRPSFPAEVRGTLSAVLCHRLLYCRILYMGCAITSLSYNWAPFYQLLQSNLWIIYIETMRQLPWFHMIPYNLKTCTQESSFVTSEKGIYTMGWQARIPVPQ